MLQTFANLPSNISEVISSLLSQEENSQWFNRAEKIHERLMKREEVDLEGYIKDFFDALAYLGLRVPSTYAQIYGAFSQIQGIVPSFKPRSLLDIGSGPGVGVWAGKTVWPSLEEATCVDQERYFLSLGQEIVQKTTFPVNIHWNQWEITEGLGEEKTKYDLVLISSVLNELSDLQRDQLLTQAYVRCGGVMVIIEPGTEYGTEIIQTVGKEYSRWGTLLAPYINNTFVEDKEYWIHFSQRFIRPEFERRLRQKMRGKTLMASDWEETKYAYVAVGKIPSEEKVWGRVVGSVKKQKGFLEVPILTKEGIKQVKVLKRHKQEYSLAKDFRWGQVVKERISGE